MILHLRIILSTGEVSVWGGLCPGGSLSRSGSLSKEPLSRAVPVLDGLCPVGGSLWGGSLSKGSLSREVSVQVGVFVRETPLR